MEGTWNLDRQGILNRSQFKRLLKHYPDEVASCAANLDLVRADLEAGKRLGSFNFGFFRPEGRGVYRIGQTRVRSAHELRLYVFPDEQAKVLRVLCLGDKSTQQADIRLCHQHVSTLQGDRQ